MRVELIERLDLRGDMLRRVEISLGSVNPITYVLALQDAAKLAAWITSLIPEDVAALAGQEEHVG